MSEHHFFTYKGENAGVEDRTMLDNDMVKETEVYLAFSSSDAIADVPRHTLKFITDYWNNPDNRKLELSSSSIAYTSETTTVIVDKINQYFINKRKGMAHTLVSGKADDASQQSINAFKQQLIDLEHSVLVLTCFATLGGKNIHSLNLIDANTIINELTVFINTANIDSALVPCLMNTSDRELRYEDINKLPALILSNEHPIRMLKQGLFKLTAYQICKSYLVSEFPLRMNYKDINEYLLQCSLLQQQLFQKETLMLLHDIRQYSTKFVSYRVKQYSSDHSVPATRDKYDDFYAELKFWALEKSAEKLSTASLDNSDVVLLSKLTKEGITNPNNDDLRLALLNGLENNLMINSSFNINNRFAWATVIGLLKQVAEKFSGIKEGQSPVNFIIWAEGLESILHLFYEKLFQPAAIENGNTTQTRLTLINQFIDAGSRLQKFILTVAQADDLFESLFDIYLENIRKYFSAWLKARKAPPLNMTDLAIYHEMVTSDTFKAGGDRIAKIAKILQSLIILYTNMALGYDLTLNESFKLITEFKNYDELLELIKETSQEAYSNNPIEKRLNDYYNKISDFKTSVLMTIQWSNDILALTAYLETLKVKDGHFILDGNQLIHNNFHLTNKNEQRIALVNKIDLVQGFITACHATKLTFINIDIDQVGMKLLSTLFLHFPSLIELNFINTNLTVNSIIPLFEVLPKFNKLTLLGLNNNKLGKSTIADLIVLSQYLSHLPPSLKQLSLSNNEFSYEGGCAVAAALTYNTTLTTVEFDNEQITEQHQQQLSKNHSLQLTYLFKHPAEVTPQSSVAKQSTVPYDYGLLMGNPALNSMMSLLYSVKVDLERRLEIELNEPKGETSAIRVDTRLVRYQSTVRDLGLWEKPEKSPDAYESSSDFKKFNYSS